MFIVIEGINKSGKTTFAHKLYKALGGSTAYPIVSSVYEPQNPFYKKLAEKAFTKTEALLAFTADRAEHMERLRPSLDDPDQIFIMDRYYYSTAVYQSAEDYTWLRVLRDQMRLFPQPDLVVWLDISAEDAFDRGADSFVGYAPEFDQVKVYREMMYHLRIDAYDGDFETLLDQIKKIHNYLKKNHRQTLTDLRASSMVSLRG